MSLAEIAATPGLGSARRKKRIILLNRQDAKSAKVFIRSSNSACELFIFMDHLQISWSKNAWKPRKGPVGDSTLREGKAVCAARLGGISLSIDPLLAFRRAQRGREKQSPEDHRTPPPQLRRDTCLRIASKMTFLPGPWNHRAFVPKRPSVSQLIWRWSKKINHRGHREKLDVKERRGFAKLYFWNHLTPESLYYACCKIFKFY